MVDASAGTAGDSDSDVGPLDDAGPLDGYSNLNPRPRGPLLTVAGWLLPGVREVQNGIEDHARAWQRDNAAALTAGPSAGPLWVALGDSLTQGVGASAHDRGWVGQLRDRLAAAGRAHRVVNLAVSGARTDDVLEVQLPHLERIARVDPPGLVTLMIGSNDLMSPRHRSEAAARMRLLLQRLPDGAVVTTLPNPGGAPAAVNAEIERAAGAGRVVVADLRDPRTTSWRGKLAADHFHPNDLGYAALADVVADALRLR